MTDCQNNSKVGVLFDLDGVLIDSEGIYSGFWAAVGRDFGLEPTFASDIKGTTLTSILNNFREEDREEVTRRIHDFEESMRYEFFPGAEEFLRHLKERGVRTAIVTSSDMEKMTHLYQQHPELPGLVDVVIDGSMVSRSKPDPEGYHRAAREIGCDPADCFVFEDSLQGLEAGRRSGATVVGIPTTNTRQAIAPLSDVVLDTFEGLTLDSLLAMRGSRR